MTSHFVPVASEVQAEAVSHMDRGEFGKAHIKFTTAAGMFRLANEPDKAAICADEATNCFLQIRAGIRYHADTLESFRAMLAEIEP